MKTFYFLLLLIISASRLSAAQASSAEIVNIESIKIEDKKIVIVGDAVFRSRMVTTEESKDSKYVIGGQPSAKYVARGKSVEFSITSYTAIFDHFPAEERKQHSKTLADFEKLWRETLLAAKKLKKGDSVSLSIQREDVRFSDGSLIRVAGCGLIFTKTANKSE